MKKTLEGEGYKVFVPPLTPSSGRLGIPYLAEQLKDYIHTHLSSDQRFHLLGYSMGGLISRYYLQRLGGLDQVEHFITISTPHHGTRTAHFVWNEGGKQMRPNSDFLKELNRDIDRLSSVRFTSIWTLWDLTIIPSNSSVISFAMNIRVNVVAHLWMVFSGRVMKEVLRVIGDPPSDPRFTSDRKEG